jgi:uncharacterized protein YjiS (DUF1127 family)
MRVLEINGAVALNMERGDLGSLWRRFVAFLSKRFEAARMSQMRQAGERELASLPDHLLTDIGVRRSDLAGVRARWFSDAFTIYGPDACSRIWGDHPRG